MLEPCAGKLACTVLRGGGDGNVASLPDRTQIILELTAYLLTNRLGR